MYYGQYADAVLKGAVSGFFLLVNKPLCVALAMKEKEPNLYASREDIFADSDNLKFLMGISFFVV